MNESNGVGRKRADPAKRWLAAVIALVFAAASGIAVAAETAKGKGKSAKGEPRKIEKLACKKGTEDNHARIAIELVNDKVREFAYYSIWKPRTCSLHAQQGDAYSKWQHFKTVTTVTLTEEMGAVLIDHDPGKYHFIFRDIDRMRYCGASGKINGSLTLVRGKSECVLDGVMDDDPSKPTEPARSIDAAEIKQAPPAAQQPGGAAKTPEGSKTPE